MRTVSEDKTYIDYTTSKFGVRVRETSCRAIFKSGDRWEEYGEEFYLPLKASMIDPRYEECLGYDLSMNVLDYESYLVTYLKEPAEPEELRAVLLGAISLRMVTGVAIG